MIFMIKKLRNEGLATSEGVLYSQQMARKKQFLFSRKDAKRREGDLITHCY